MGNIINVKLIYIVGADADAVWISGKMCFTNQKLCSTHVHVYTFHNFKEMMIPF